MLLLVRPDKLAFNGDERGFEAFLGQLSRAENFWIGQASGARLANQGLSQQRRRPADFRISDRLEQIPGAKCDRIRGDDAQSPTGIQREYLLSLCAQDLGRHFDRLKGGGLSIKEQK